MVHRLVGALAAALLGLACQTVCDARSAPACCARPLYTAPSKGSGPRYRILDQLTVTCPPLNPKRCERLLKARACELGADVLVTHTWTLVGRRGPAQITKEALLVRFEDEPH